MEVNCCDLYETCDNREEIPRSLQWTGIRDFVVIDSTVSSLPHWGRVMHIWVSNLTVTGSDIGLSPGRRQAIIWTNAGLLLIGSLGTNFSEI